MEGFDDAGVFYSDDLRDVNSDGQSQTRQAVKQKLKEFLRQFHDGNFHYKYRYFYPVCVNKFCMTLNLIFRDTLKRNYNIGQYYLEVNLEDLASFNDTLADKFYKEPIEHHPLVTHKP